MDQQSDRSGEENKADKAEKILEVSLIVVIFLFFNIVIKVLDVCSLVIVAFAFFGIVSSVYRMSEGNWAIDVIGILLVSLVILWLYYFVRPKYKKSRRYKVFEQRWL